MDSDYPPPSTAEVEKRVELYTPLYTDYFTLARKQVLTPCIVMSAVHAGITTEARGEVYAAPSKRR